MPFAVPYSKLKLFPTDRHIYVIIGPCPPSCSSVPIGVQLPFRVYKVQEDGNLHFVEAVQTYEDAKARVRELGELWHGQYVIENQETGKRVVISVGDKSKN